MSRRDVRLTCTNQRQDHLWTLLALGVGDNAPCHRNTALAAAHQASDEVR